MPFNSYIFILVFLPCTIFGYYITTNRNANAGKLFLIVASTIFYGFSGKYNLLILVASIGFNYVISKYISKKNKTLLVIGISANIILLGYCKYYNFLIFNIDRFLKLDFVTRNIILPLGISFYTFQQIQYLVSAYEGECEKGSFIDYVLYIIYFPKILMGPLTEPAELIGQFNQCNRKQINYDNIVAGIEMFGYGLFKKVIIADTFAKAVDWGFGDITRPTAGEFIIIMLAYTFQIYFDFSGYSDMAIGISKMLNIELPINFDSPYKSFSIREFWKKWHISLTNFFTKYIYIPIGGSRKGKVRTYINTMLIFLISGIWHGASWTYIVWGVIHGTACVVERIIGDRWNKIHAAVRWFMTFLNINILWLLFRSESVTAWIKILYKIICFNSMEISDDFISIFNLPEYNFLFNICKIDIINAHIRGFAMLIMFMLAFIICLCCENNYKSKKSGILGAVLTPICITWSLISLSAETTFVYFNF